MTKHPILVFTLVLILGLAACTGGAAPTASDAAGDAAAEGGKQQVTISMWTHDQLYVDFFSDRAAVWEENYPDIEFIYDFQQVPDVFTKVLANLASGEPVPDLIGLEQGAFPRFMKDDIIASKFVSLTDLIGGEREDFVEGRWTPYMHNGNIYGVESALSATIYYYQPAIFEEYGLEVPTTWDEFLDVGEILAQDGVAMLPMTNSSSYVLMFFLQRGGQFFDEQGNFVFGEEPNRTIALEVLQLLRAGLDSGMFHVALGGDFWGPPLFNAYAEGKLAGAIMPDWYSEAVLKPQAADMEGQWRVAPMPVWSDGKGHTTSVWGGTGFAITSESENPELVWDLLHFSYMTKENQILRFEMIQYYPHMIEALNDPRISELTDPYYGDQAIGSVLASVAEDTPIWYQSQFRDAFQTEFTAQLPAFFEGTTTDEELIDAVVEVTNKEIADYQ
ncbi:ABC transporter substrate-binding protein [Chloroflexi bacterium TSY]|nr:ABC transporter substrate-binding protein [Chloroflexi bacterium TSY]